jgi:hypothetical protein
VFFTVFADYCSILAQKFIFEQMCSLKRTVKTAKLQGNFAMLRPGNALFVATKSANHGKRKPATGLSQL